MRLREMLQLLLNRVEIPAENKELTANHPPPNLDLKFTEFSEQIASHLTDVQRSLGYTIGPPKSTY
jgi:hypothetical protein